MRKMFRFRYRRRNTDCKDMTSASEYGEANVEVYGLSDIETLIRVSGLDIHDARIVSVKRDDDRNTRKGFWAEYNFVYATKGKQKSKTVFVGVCNFHEGNGKRDS